MALNTGSSKLGNTVSTLIALILALVLINEVGQYAVAWARIGLATRDARSAILDTVREAPADRDAAARAAQVACSRYKVTLGAYGHVYETTMLGPRVQSQIDMAVPAKGAIVTALVNALISDGTLARWRTHAPTVEFTYNRQFVAEAQE